MGTKENEFTEKLRMLMDERDMKQKDVATALHIPVSTLGGYVQGKSLPDFAMLKLLSNYFNVSIDYLLWHESLCGKRTIISAFDSCHFPQLFIAARATLLNKRNLAKQF